MSEFMPGVVCGLIMASAVHIWSPSAPLSPEVFVKASAVCAANGGVKFLYPHGWMGVTSEVSCANGAKFTIKNGAS